MNNWRLLLLAVVAVLQPIGSYTERNLIDGRQECCDHRSNTFIQEIKVQENSRRHTPENRRLNSGDVREDRQRSDARNDRIRSRDRLTVEKIERRVSPESEAKFNDARLARDQERHQRLNVARESRQTRNHQSRRYRERIFRDSLSRYERDVNSRRIRMSREDTRIEDDNQERLIRESSRLQDNRRATEFGDIRRDSVNRETMLHRRERKVVARERHHNFRISISRTENSLQHNNNREDLNFDQRVREITKDNRHSRSLDSRLNSFERKKHRDSFRSSSERVDVRSRDQNRQSRDRTITSQDSSKRTFADRRREAIEPVQQIRRIMNEYRTKNNRIEFRDTSSERLARESGKNDERRNPLSRETRTLDENARSKGIVKNNNRQQGIQSSRISDETRRERHQPLSPDRTRANEREFATRLSDRTAVRDARAVNHGEDTRSAERLEKRRERYGIRMSRGRQISMLQESRESTERKQETRNESPSRFEVRARSERELRLHKRDVARSDDSSDRKEGSVSREKTHYRMTRDTQHRVDGKLLRNNRFTTQVPSDERFSEIRENIRREVRDENRDRTIVMQRLTRDVSTTHRRSDIRRTESNTRLKAARTLAHIQNERQVTARDERETRNRISVSRLSSERIEIHEPQKMRHSRASVRNEMLLNREVRMTRKESHRHEDFRSHQDRVLQRQSRDMLTARSIERRFREIGARDVEIQSERLSHARDEKRINKRDVKQRELRAVETRRESRRVAEKQVLPNRKNLAIERHAFRDIGIEARSRSDTVLFRDIRDHTRRDARDTRFQSFAAQVREIDHIETSIDKNAMSWQMVFYTLHLAYLCGLLMQMLTEKSNKGKSRNITAWWYSAPKNLVKVD